MSIKPLTEGPDGLSEGVVVVIHEFDEVPEHLFLIQTVEEDHVTGIAQSGPLAGAYGEPPIELIRGIHVE
ncbi:MAG: hypothetical protein CMH12_19070 [Maritimibacter sp.]|nr:hypothetical protein [Maritimibacter sp.]|tara:strand:- start:264 stop:473 length:210 start_codon:yes stop_codon:yes gene_type:complete